MNQRHLSHNGTGIGSGPSMKAAQDAAERDAENGRSYALCGAAASQVDILIWDKPILEAERENLCELCVEAACRRGTPILNEREPG